MSLRSFRRRHPAFVVACVLIVSALLALDGAVSYKRARYVRETDRLRAGMTDLERKKSDAILALEERRFEMMMQLLRRQAKLDEEIHLAVSVDSGRMYLEREGALLREISVEMGPGRRVGTPPDTVYLASPRGTRSVQRVLGDSDRWEIPRWVYQDRGLPVPDDRALPGALGPVSIILDGGTVIYSLPTAGPLNDSSYLLPGAVRASAADLQAIVQNIGRGTSVYFY